MNSTDLIPWLGFSIVDGIGPMRFKLMKEYFGSAQKAWEAPTEKLKEIGLGDKILSRFLQFRESHDIEKYIQIVEEKQIIILAQDDKRYPKRLKQISDPPIVLYVRGTIDDGLLDSSCVGVVGARKMTAYGEDATRKISMGLARAGVTIVSGMAFGVDTIAHQSAIEMGGKTIAVLGCGIDIAYPRENENLYHSIIQKHGAVISEFPPGRMTSIGLFPSRNRIISGLSLGIVVTEGTKQSGSLITAKDAALQGREVFAVPGLITSEMSQGPTILLKQGAKLVTEAQDILDELKISLPRRLASIRRSGQAGSNSVTQSLNKSKNGKWKKLSVNEKKIIETLQKESLHFDALVVRTKIAASALGSLLTIMEMNGLIKKNDQEFTLV